MNDPSGRIHPPRTVGTVSSPSVFGSVIDAEFGCQSAGTSVRDGDRNEVRTPLALVNVSVTSAVGIGPVLGANPPNER